MNIIKYTAESPFFLQAITAWIDYDEGILSTPQLYYILDEMFNAHHQFNGRL